MRSSAIDLQETLRRLVSNAAKSSGTFEWTCRISCWSPFIATLGMIEAYLNSVLHLLKRRLSVVKAGHFLTQNIAQCVSSAIVDHIFCTVLERSRAQFCHLKSKGAITSEPFFNHSRNLSIFDTNYNSTIKLRLFSIVLKIEVRGKTYNCETSCVGQLVIFRTLVRSQVKTFRLGPCQGCSNLWRLGH